MAFLFVKIKEHYCYFLSLNSQNNLKIGQNHDITLYKINCSKKVFFRAGVLAHLEEKRDEALGAIILKLQRQCRYWLAIQDYKRRREQQFEFYKNN